MERIKTFLKNHNLKEELLSDESFVEESEKMFKEHGLEFSKKQLEEIIGDIEENLDDVKELPESELKDIVGGVKVEDPTPVDHKKQSSGNAAIAVKATGTIIGAILGGVLGIGLSTEYNYDRTGGSWRSVTVKPNHGLLGAGVGSVIGYQLGNLVAKKCHLQ